MTRSRQRAGQNPNITGEAVRTVVRRIVDAYVCAAKQAGWIERKKDRPNPTTERARLFGVTQNLSYELPWTLIFYKYKKNLANSTVSNQCVYTVLLSLFLVTMYVLN